MTNLSRKEHDVFDNILTFPGKSAMSLKTDFKSEFSHQHSFDITFLRDLKQASPL